MEKKPSISIITPAYNAQKTLAKAVNSVLEQQFEDWELLIVNDGSKDNTEKIAEEFAHKDSRIHVITQRNGGRSSARNAGLQAVTGDYIAFLDADDTFLPNTLKDLFNSIQRNNSDLAVGEVLAQGYRPALKDDFFKEQNAICYLFSLRGNQRLFNSIWNKLFKREIIAKNKIQFPAGIEMGEDVIFVLSYMLHIKTLSTVSAPVYNYLPQENSITKKPFSIDYVDREHTGCLLWVDIFNKWNLPAAQVYGSFFTPRMFGCTHAVKEDVSLLKEIVRRTFEDKYILDFAEKVKNTPYDNLYATLLRGHHVRTWTLLALGIGLVRKVKGK